MDSFKYLGSMVTDDENGNQEIRTRIAATKSASNNVERVLDQFIHSYVPQVENPELLCTVTNAICNRMLDHKYRY